MKVVHIESGLGNQMLSYCEMLAMKKVHPEEQCYLETIIYDYKEAGEVICQWNGYELGRVFGIEDSNVKELFDDRQWQAIHDDILKTRFWEKNWNWPVYFTAAFARQGLKLHNLRGDFEQAALKADKSAKGRLRKNPIYQNFQTTWIYANLRTFQQHLKPYTRTDTSYLFYEGKEDVLTGQKLTFMHRNNQIEQIDAEIRKAFIFPKFEEGTNGDMSLSEDRKNRAFLEEMRNRQTVAIHVRRGDMLNLSARYYFGGYFKRAVGFMKKRIEKPVFCFFCDPASVEWCKQNEKVFGLDFKRDEVIFVDWNRGENSFRDMQLMSQCRHNIITTSSFGWWGAYLNQNPDKITISPEIYVNTTHHL